MNNGSYAHLKIAGKELHPDIPHENEDAVVTRELGPDSVLDVVLDGVSSASGMIDGKMASEIVAERLERGKIRAFTGADIDGPLRDVLGSLEGVHTEFKNYNARREEGGQVITTVTFALKLGNMLYVANIGDSPAYLASGPEISESTDTTHDKTNPQTKKCELAMIFNAVGMPTMHADIDKVKLKAGDKLILATDGISDNLYLHEIAECLKLPTPQEAMSALEKKLKEKKAADKSRHDTFGAFKPDDATAIIRYL